MTNLYDILGVATDATPEKIKRAYRAKAMKTHPDRGGTYGDFQCLSRAYEVLSDPERRARYDRDGFTGEAPDLDAKVHQDLASLVLSVLDQINPDRSNLVEVMINSLRVQMANHQSALNACDAKILSRETAIKRLSSRDGDSFLTQVLVGDIAAQRAAKLKIEEVIAYGHKLLEALHGYEYKVDAPMFRPTMSTTATTAFL